MNKFILNILYRIIPGEYIIELFSRYELYLEKLYEEQQKERKRIAVQEMRDFLDGKPIDYLEKLCKENLEKKILAQKMF